jgi:hypothetical protein
MRARGFYHYQRNKLERRRLVSDSVTGNPSANTSVTTV